MAEELNRYKQILEMRGERIQGGNGSRGKYLLVF